MGRKLFSPKGEKTKDKVPKHPLEDDYMLINDFDSGSKSSLGINCNVVFVLPIEHDQVMEVEEIEKADDVEMAKHRPLCYYIMNNGCVEEQNTFYEQPDEGMKNHLKPLLIRGKIEN